MDQQRYLALIERLEHESRARPQRFRARVLLVSLGVYGAELGLLLLAWLGCHALLRRLPAVDATLVAAVLGALAALLLKWLLWPRGRSTMYCWMRATTWRCCSSRAGAACGDAAPIT